jgi:hypothetical protein
MAIDPNNFWSSNYYHHPQLTDAMIEVAQVDLGVKLPMEYLSLLRIQNGGYTKGFGFPMTEKTTWADDHVPLSELAGIVIDPTIETAQNIINSRELTNEWDLPPQQILLTGDGHWWITLDYRKGEIPSVAWIDVDSGEDIRVAATFSDFLAGLRVDEEFVVG